VRLNRVFVDEPIRGRRTLELGGSAANHVARVLRLRAGDALVVFDGRGGEYAATVAGLGKERLTVTVGEHVAAERDPDLAITLVQGIARGERMDMVIQKATELGVARIVPVATERSVVKTSDLRARRKREHWRAIAIAACEQCGRNRLPDVEPPTDWQAWLAGRAPAALSLLLSTRSPTRLGAVLAAVPTIELLIGPEGGLTAAEEDAALAAGFHAVRLGPRVLRTETAAIAALAAIQQQCGDF
jgi:16S rRNA (uracil1498-N3)-methyltransferase